MSYKYQFRRGAEKDLPLLDNAEPAFTEDTEDLYIGTPRGNKKLTFDATKHQELEDHINSVVGINLKYPPAPLTGAYGKSRFTTGEIIDAVNVKQINVESVVDFKVGDTVYIEGEYKAQKIIQIQNDPISAGDLVITTPEGVNVTIPITLQMSRGDIAFEIRRQVFPNWKAESFNYVVTFTSNSYGEKGDFILNAGSTGLTFSQTTQPNTVIKTGVVASIEAQPSPVITLVSGLSLNTDTKVTVYHDDTNAIKSIIEYANGRKVFVPKDDYIITQDVDTSSLEGEGRLIKDGSAIKIPNPIVDLNEQLAQTENDIFGRGVNVLYPPVPLVGAKVGLDASTVIQNIMNAISANGGGKVLIPSVKLRLSNSIFIPTNVILEGQGNTTEFQVDIFNQSAIYLRAIYMTNKLENSGLRNVKITTTGFNSATELKNSAAVSIYCDVHNPSNNGDPNDTGEIHYLTFENVTIDGFKTGVYLGRNTFVEKAYIYKGLDIKNCYYGIYLDDYCEYTTITESNIQKCTHGIYDNGASNCSFVVNHIHNNLESGIYLYKTGRNTYKKLISLNHINHNKRGIWLGSGIGTIGQGISKVQINTNQIFANTAQGVVCSGGMENQINDNYFSGNGGGTANDIYISGVSKHMMIHDNHFENINNTSIGAINIQQPGISDANSFLYNSVEGNVFINYDIDKEVVVTKLGSLPIDVNSNIINGVFEYYNSAGQPPTENHPTQPKANVNFRYLPQGTICVNNAVADGSEMWLLMKKPSSSGVNEVIFKAL